MIQKQRSNERNKMKNEKLQKLICRVDKLLKFLWLKEQKNMIESQIRDIPMQRAYGMGEDYIDMPKYGDDKKKFERLQKRLEGTISEINKIPLE